MTKTRTEKLWADLQEIQRKEMDLLKRHQAELEQEKSAMNSLAPDASEIVSIIIGGEIFVQVHRDTLLLPAGSRFAALFSGRWEDHCVKDSEGRVFLDHDPELIRIILSYIRMKRIEDPSDLLDPPVVPKEKLKEGCCLLKHYGRFSPSVSRRCKFLTLSSSSLKDRAFRLNALGKDLNLPMRMQKSSITLLPAPLVLALERKRRGR
jgi:hypothetical protein